MDDDLIAAHGDCDKLMPYLHLPLQSGWRVQVYQAVGDNEFAAEWEVEILGGGSGGDGGQPQDARVSQLPGEAQEKRRHDG